MFIHVWLLYFTFTNLAPTVQKVLFLISVFLRTNVNPIKVLFLIFRSNINKAEVVCTHGRKRFAASHVGIRYNDILFTGNVRFNDARYLYTFVLRHLKSHFAIIQFVKVHRAVTCVLVITCCLDCINRGTL